MLVDDNKTCRQENNLIGSLLLIQILKTEHIAMDLNHVLMK